MTPAIYGLTRDETWKLDGSKEPQWTVLVQHDLRTGGILICKAPGCADEEKLNLKADEASALALLLIKLLRVGTENEAQP